MVLLGCFYVSYSVTKAARISDNAKILWAVCKTARHYWGVVAFVQQLLCCIKISGALIKLFTANEGIRQIETRVTSRICILPSSNFYVYLPNEPEWSFSFQEPSKSSHAIRDYRGQEVRLRQREPEIEWIWEWANIQDIVSFTFVRFYGRRLGMPLAHPALISARSESRMQFEFQRPLHCQLNTKIYDNRRAVGGELIKGDGLRVVWMITEIRRYLQGFVKLCVICSSKRIGHYQLSLLIRHNTCWRISQLILILSILRQI